MENVKHKSVFFDQWTAELFSNFTGVTDQWTWAQQNKDHSAPPSGLYRESLIEKAEDFIEVIERHFEGTSLNNTAEEIADYYIIHC